MTDLSHLWRRTPPAVFPVLLGLLGLGLGWRRFVGAHVLTELALLIVCVFYIFLTALYIAKLMRHANILRVELTSPPAQAGVAAIPMSGMLVAAVVIPYAPHLAIAILGLSVLGHLVYGVALTRHLRAAGFQSGQVTPALHLPYVGLVLAPMAAIPLGMDGLSWVLLLVSVPGLVVIGWLSIRNTVQAGMPPPLRPTHAIHVAALSIFGSVLWQLGAERLACALLILAGLVTLVLAVRWRWLTAAGFTPVWGAFTFPMAALAGLFQFRFGGDAGIWVQGPLVLATFLILPIAARLLRRTVNGALAQQTGAAPRPG